jgi:ribA/ribD-fused uncharacterized protein
MIKIDDQWTPTVTDQGIYGFFAEYRWLSNFHQSFTFVEGIAWQSVEHAYQASKTMNTYERSLFQMLTPAQAKRFGKEITLRQDWEAVKIKVMYDCLKAKFCGPDPECAALMKRLKETGKLYLEETNYWGDTFWGVCDGKGTNILGKLLMCVRDGEDPGMLIL